MSLSQTSSRNRILSDRARQTLSHLGEELPTGEGWQVIRVVAVSESSSDSDASVNIPEVLESPEAMQFLGFTETAAAAIYARYLQGSVAYQDEEIIEYAKGCIRSGTDAGTQSDDWDAAIASMGIRSDVRQQIMDPRFQHIRLTANAMHWVRDTIMAKYDYLTALDRTVIGSEPVSLEARMRNPGQSSGGGGGSSSKPSNQGTANPPQPQIATATIEKTVQHDEVELLKGTSIDRLSAAINLESDTRNRIQNVVSKAPGDFSGDEAILYLSKQRQVAYEYATYAQTRVREQGEDLVGVGILHVIIPRDLLANSAEVYGLDWKEFVWNHRLQLPTPERLAYIDEADVIVGPILKCSQAAMMKHRDVNRNFTVLEPMKLSAGEMTEWCALKGISLHRNINRRGRFWVERLEGLERG